MPELTHWGLKRVDSMTREEAIAALRECAQQLREAQERNKAILREWRRVAEARERCGKSSSILKRPV